MNHYIKSLVERFDFGSVKSDKNTKIVKNAAPEFIKYHYSIEIKKKILNHIKLNPEEIQILHTYAPEFKKYIKIDEDELLALIIYYLVDNKADNLDWLDIDKFLEENELEMDPQEKYILTYIPTKEDISKIKEFLKTIKDLEATLPENSFPPLTLVISPLNDNCDIITDEWGDWKHSKLAKKFIREVGFTQIDGNYTATNFLENEYLLCLLIKQLSFTKIKRLYTIDEDGKEEYDIHINIGYNLLDLNNTLHLNDIIQKISKIKYIQKKVSIDLMEEGYCFIWVEKFKNLDNILDKLIIFAKEYINQCNLYIKEIEDDE